MAGHNPRSGPFVIVAEFEVKPDKLEQFLELARTDAAHSVEREPGCRQLDVTLDREQPNRVLLYEIYDDEAAFGDASSRGVPRRYRKPDREPAGAPPHPGAWLRNARMEIKVLYAGPRALTQDELIELPSVFGIMAGGEPYTERVFAAAPELKVVARMGVGYDKVDVAAATRASHLERYQKRLTGG
jgi:quinol monooxygenase YgiN